MNQWQSGIVVLMASGLAWTTACGADDATLTLKLRSRRDGNVSSNDATWRASETALIVCDLWDAHHCLNAVRRLEEFAPRLNEVVKEARRRGVTIIHSPSDCMGAYAEHPARKRAQQTPQANPLPPDIATWCSRIPAEELAVYPLDQSDGGEDDNPTEHAAWRAKLAAQGRNPNLPWQKQLATIEIDAERDFISDRGDEVWSVLQSRGVKNVILTGVHANMCVLGRPFGLRQMVRNGKRTVLMRDMTDCMYNPQRWPYVDHFTGNDLLIEHVEQFVCPTITSDQLIGGSPHRSKFDKRPPSESPRSLLQPPLTRETLHKDWSLVLLPHSADVVKLLAANDRPAWYRCTIRIAKSWSREPVTVSLPSLAESKRTVRAWLNGQPLVASGTVLQVPSQAIVFDDANLLVIRCDANTPAIQLGAPQLAAGSHKLELRGRWQLRLGDDDAWTNMPLPAKFGTSASIVFETK